jgi:serine phosphatase RsbU (regulator of sigma subunit)
MLRWFAGAYLLLLGMSFLILPRGPINPLHGLVWFRGPAFVLSGIAVLWLAVLPMTRRQSLAAHMLVAVPPLAVAAEYIHLQSYGPAMTLLLLGLALAVSPLARSRPPTRSFRPDALGIVLGLALGAQGLELLSVLNAPHVIPYGLQAAVGIVYAVFGFGTAACHLVPRTPGQVRYAAEMGAGLSLLALWIILALGYGPILWLLNFSAVILAAAFIAMPWLSGPIASFAPDTVHTRVAGYLFTGALVPLLITVPLVLATPGMSGSASTSTRQLAFGVSIAMSIVAGAAGWWLAGVLAHPIARLLSGVEAIARGVRPVTLAAGGPSDVEVMTAAIQAMAANLDEQVAAVERVRDQHKSVADKLQSALQVPVGFFPEIDVAVVYHSASEVAELGGDFYDVFRTGKGGIGVLIGDVSGRGLDAAAQAVLIRANLRALMYSTDSPAAALTNANRLLLDSGTAGFVTAFLGMLDPASGDLVYSTAGHPPPLLLSDGKAAFSDAGSPVLGVFDAARFHDAHVHLTAGDTLLLYTDGLTEAKKDFTLFGEERLLAEAEALSGMPPTDLTRSLYALVEGHAGGTLADDVALLALRLQGGTMGALSVSC